MAATANDYSKLSFDDLQDKLKEVKDRALHLEAIENRGPDEDAELTDRLDEFDSLTAHISAKKNEETNRRLERLRKFDAPAQRKTGGSNGGVQPVFSCFGEKLSAISKSVHGHMDQRLRNALGANEATPSDGGFFVGTDAESELMSKVYGSPILARVSRTQISAASNMLKLRMLKEESRADGSRQGGVQAYWEGEGDGTTATRRAYEELELTLKKLLATSYATSELLEDYSALESEMSAGYVEEMTFKIEDAIINGDGVGKPLGIRNSAAKVTVAAESSQTTAEPLLYENIVKMYARLHPRSQMNAIWLVDQTLIPYLMTLSIAVGTGGIPVYQPANGAADAPFGTVLGRPVVFTEYTQAKNTEGDIILWDPSTYRLIEKGGFRSASSMHVAFLTDEMAFRWTYRANGASKWRAPLTPKNSGDTLSPIVTLATRT